MAVQAGFPRSTVIRHDGEWGKAAAGKEYVRVGEGTNIYNYGLAMGRRCLESPNNPSTESAGPHRKCVQKGYIFEYIDNCEGAGNDSAGVL